jgi:hypothetical protein
LLRFLSTQLVEIIGRFLPQTANDVQTRIQ